MIHFDNVSKRYPNGHEALRQISFAIAPGEMAFLTGHSGAGKSTLLKLIMLTERASQGRIVINRQDYHGLRGNQIAHQRRHIGMVHQDHRLLMDRSVYDNVALPLIIGGVEPTLIPNRVHAALDMVGLRDKVRALPEEISGGEQQRVGIARAVVNRPPLLLADEPTGNLDAELATGIMDVFEDLAQVGVTVLLASHDLPLIARYHHRLLTLRDGQLLGDTA